MYPNGQTKTMITFQRSSAFNNIYSVCYYSYPNFRTETISISYATIWLVRFWETGTYSVSVSWVTGTASSSICSKISHSHMLYNSHRFWHEHHQGTIQFTLTDSEVQSKENMRQESLQLWTFNHVCKIIFKSL